MDWELISFYQGTDDNSDPSVATIQCYYQGRAICYETTCNVPIENQQGSGGWTAYLNDIASSVISCCGATIPNPMYDAELTACWT